MKAIRTHYAGPTDCMGSRIIATAEGGHRIIEPFDHAAREPHDGAALALCAKLGWEGDMIAGVLPDGDHAYVFTGRSRANMARVVDPYSRKIVASVRIIRHR